MAHTITHGGSDRLDVVSSLFGRVFDNDPVLAYMLLNMSQPDRLAYLGPYWKRLIKAAVLNDGIITEIDGWKAAAVLLPPGKSIDNVWTMLPAGILSVFYHIGFAGCVRMLREYAAQADAAKKMALKGRKKWYYIFGIGTEYEHQGKGLARAILEEYQDTAREKNVPIWLEATTAHSHGIYLRMGFEDVEEIVLGKGRVSADGERQEGGCGVSVWTMVWWPKRAE